MRFAIVGAGAIGCLFGAKLKLAGHDVTLLHRNAAVVGSIRKNGIHLQETGGTARQVYIPIRKGPADLPGIDTLVVAVKAYDTRTVAKSYRDLVRRETAIVSLQNGLGNVEVLRSLLSSNLFAGSTTEGALSTGPGRVVHTGRGVTIVGDPKHEWSDSLVQLKVALAGAGLKTTISRNIHGVLWTKAIVNAAINPLSSLTRLPNGSLAIDLSLQAIARDAMEEGVAVSKAIHIRLEGDPRRLWRRILLSTRANKSSMLQDVESGKMTEIRQLNGAIVSYGRKTGIATPVNEILTNLVLGLEASLKTS